MAHNSPTDTRSRTEHRSCGTSLSTRLTGALIEPESADALVQDESVARRTSDAPSQVLFSRELAIRSISRWAAANGLNPFRRELALRLQQHRLQEQEFTVLRNRTDDPVPCGYCARALYKKDRKLCSGCRAIFYCGCGCQWAGWKRHKPKCDPDFCVAFLGESGEGGIRYEISRLPPE